jgi:acyl-CoA synthetase (AMP-forming)/AMP-acid ligase II
MTTPWVNFGDLIDPAADLDRTALIDAADPAAPREWTFRQLDRAADGVAHALWARGHRRGERVAIAAANSGAYLAALFGIMRAGLVAVPVNFKLPRPTIEFVLGDAGVSLVFADRERRPDCPPDLPVLDLDAAVAEAADRHGDAAPFPTVVPAAGEISLILYTSGSTGRPKGVPLTHDGQLWAVGQRMLSADDPERHRLLVAAPYYHMNGLYVSAMALAARSSVVLLPQFQVRAYLEATARFGCTWITSIPTMLALLVRETELLARIDLSAVERVATGSAPLTQGLIDRIRAVFPRAIFTNGYGTTETGAIAFGPHPRGLPRPDLALGHPIPGVRLRLVRGNSGRRP